MTVLRYRGRDVKSSDVEEVRVLIREHPQASRRALSLKLCERWGWVQPNGAPRDGVARGLLLELHRSGRIELPPPRHMSKVPAYHRKSPAAPVIDPTPLRSPLSELRPLCFRQVRRTAEEPLFNALVAAHHYLGYTQPVGAHLKYLVFAGERPVACVSWSSAPRHLGPRDRFIGWSKDARRQNIRFVAYNPRFLILPWVEVPHLASHVLGRMVRVLVRDWERAYGHPLHFLETFVDPSRFRGTCYRAANWSVLGRTTGRGKDAQTKHPNRPIKEVLGYPLSKGFRELLSVVG